MKKFTLSCLSTNPTHTKFQIYDPHGANCGEITVLSEDAEKFVAFNWSGTVLWNGKQPVKKEIEQ